MISFVEKSFSQLSNKELYDLLKLRSDVFVVEQNCVYPDLDDKDTHEHLVHLLAFESDALVAYARILPAGISYESVSIGRVVVDKNFRGDGLAKALMKKAISIAFTLSPHHTIEIGAQCYLQQFYASLGFVNSSEPYDEDGIMHIDMLLTRG